MSRLIVDVTGEQHQMIKALAATEGKTIKHYVLEKILPADQTDEDTAWNELKQVLQERIALAKQGNVSNRTIRQIADDKVKAMQAQ